MSTSVLKALPGKLDIKRYSPIVFSDCNIFFFCFKHPNVSLETLLVVLQLTARDWAWPMREVVLPRQRPVAMCWEGDVRPLIQSTVTFVERMVLHTVSTTRVFEKKCQNGTRCGHLPTG